VGYRGDVAILPRFRDNVPMTKVITMFVAASVFGLLAQIEDSMWEKSAWVIMCVTFLSGLAYMGKWIQKLVKDGSDGHELEIARLRAELDEIRKSIKHD